MFTYVPEFGAQKQEKPRVTNIQLGDGYSQRVASGINTRAQVWNLVFANREKTEADAIDAFLQARNGVESFDWTPPDLVVAKKFVCQEWNRTIEKANRYTITATFVEVFDP